jgi:hypothetical protein
VQFVTNLAKIFSPHTHTHTHTHTRTQIPKRQDSSHANRLGGTTKSSVRSSMEMHFSSMFLVYYTSIICVFMNNTDCQGRGRYCFLSCHMYCFISKVGSLSVLGIYDEDVCISDPPLHMWIMSCFYFTIFKMLYMNMEMSDDLCFFSTGSTIYAGRWPPSGSIPRRHHPWVIFYSL